MICSVEALTIRDRLQIPAQLLCNCCEFYEAGVFSIQYYPFCPYKTFKRGTRALNGSLNPRAPS